MTVSSANTVYYLIEEEIAKGIITDNHFKGKKVSDWTAEDWENALAEAQKETEKYAENNLRPVISEEKLIELIESHPRDINNPQHLTRFTREQREERRKTIKMFREIGVEFAFGIAERNAKYARIRRPWLVLLGSTGTAEAAQNEEIVKLFSNDGMPDPTYRQSKIDELIAGNTDPQEAAKQVDEALNARRVEIVMERLNASKKVLDNLDAMTDLSLPPEQLALNYYSILSACNYYMEAENFPKEPSLPLTQEQRQWIAEAKQNIDKLQAARGKLAYMGNPLYEYIDLQELGNYDMEGLEEAYEQEIFKRTKKRGERKLPGKVEDDFNAAIGDVTDIVTTAMIVTRENAKQLAASYGMDVNAKWYCEEINGGMLVGGDSYAPQLANGDYLAVEQGNRVIILAPPQFGSTNVEILQQPELYFNARFGSRINTLMQMRAEVDPGYIKSSPQFKAMQTSLEALAAMGKMPPFPDGDTIARYRAQLEDLGMKCRDYMDYKGDPDSIIAERRVFFARHLDKFVDMKLHQIELMQKATATLERYSELTPEQRAAMITRDKMEYIANWRATSPLEWTGMNKRPYERHANAAVLTCGMNDAYDSLKKNSFASVTAEQDTVRLVGTMIASQIYMNEQDPALAGTFKSLFTIRKNPAVPDDADKLFTPAVDWLGEAVVQDILGDAPRTPEALANVLTAFEPTAVAEKYRTELCEQYDLKYTQILHRQYVELTAELPENTPQKLKNALRDFARENIVDLALDIKRTCMGDVVMRPEQTRLLAANCVIYGMIAIERTGAGNAAPGELEQMLADPDKVSTLRNSIMSSDKFETLCKDCFLTADDVYEYNMVKKLLSSKKPMRTAKALLTTAVAGIQQKRPDAPQQERNIEGLVNGQPANGQPANGQPGKAAAGGPVA